MHIRTGESKWLSVYVQETIDLNLSFEEVIEKLMDSAYRKLKTNQPSIEFGIRWGSVITHPPANNKRNINAPPVNINLYGDFDLPIHLEALVSMIRPLIKSKKHLGTQMLYVLATVPDDEASIRDSGSSRATTSQEAFERKVRRHQHFNVNSRLQQQTNSEISEESLIPHLIPALQSSNKYKTNIVARNAQQMVIVLRK
jgi:hypothetical protein